MTVADRSRHESVGEHSPKLGARDSRFPSSMVDSNQFLRIVSWRDQSDAGTMTPSPSSDIDLTGNMRSWYRNMSRKKVLIIFFTLLAFLFITAVIITVTLIVVLQSHGKNEHEFTAIVMTVTTPTTPTATPFPYVAGYVIGTEFRYVPLGTVESLVPDIRGFIYREQLLAWGDNTISLIENYTVSQGALDLNTGNCTSCFLLSAADECLQHNVTPLRCSQSQSIYCCSGCPFVDNLCRVKGTFYQFSDPLIEARISADGDTLLLTTASLINTSNCVLQSHRIRNDGSIFSGPIRKCYGSVKIESNQDPKFVNLATTTFSIDSATYADLLVAVDVNGNVLLHNLTTDTILTYIPLKIEGDVLSISTTIQGDNLMIALLQTSRFYAIRFSLISGCVSLLENYYQNFLYSGELRDVAWAGENLIVWYVDREGVNIVQFQFKWNPDNVC